jgi:DNA-binding MarR family transcriptional regulator
LQEWTEVFMHRSFRDFKHFMDEANLSPSQVGALMRLYHRGACGVSDIGSHMGITIAASSQMVERLVQMNFLQRSEDPLDRRVKQLTLTPQGRALVEQGIAARRRWLEDLTASLSPEQQASIADALLMLTQAARQAEGMP